MRPATVSSDSPSAATPVQSAARWTLPSVHTLPLNQAKQHAHSCSRSHKATRQQCWRQQCRSYHSRMRTVQARTGHAGVPPAHPHTRTPTHPHTQSMVSFARVYRVGVWLGFFRSALLLVVVLRWVDCFLGSWLLLGLLCILRVTQSKANACALLRLTTPHLWPYLQRYTPGQGGCRLCHGGGPCRVRRHQHAHASRARAARARRPLRRRGARARWQAHHQPVQLRPPVRPPHPPPPSSCRPPARSHRSPATSRRAFPASAPSQLPSERHTEQPHTGPMHGQAC